MIHVHIISCSFILLKISNIDWTVQRMRNSNKNFMLKVLGKKMPRDLIPSMIKFYSLDSTKFIFFKASSIFCFKLMSVGPTLRVKYRLSSFQNIPLQNHLKTNSQTNLIEQRCFKLILGYVKCVFRLCKIGEFGF
jgi:hypothetical protein